MHSEAMPSDYNQPSVCVQLKQSSSSVAPLQRHGSKARCDLVSPEDCRHRAQREEAKGMLRSECAISHGTTTISIKWVNEDELQ